MNLITPKFEIISQKSGLDEMFKHIERAGRTCYRSEDKITEGSAEKFVERMKSNQHLSVLEHGTLYLTVIVDNACSVGVHEYQRQRHKFFDFITKYSHNKFSALRIDQNKKAAFATTNYRVIVENGWEDDLQYMCEPTEFHEKRVTVRFNTDIGISREFNRHRVNSISEESTRYCNYSKGKFGGELSVVPPIGVRIYAKGELKTMTSWYNNEDNYFSTISHDMSQIVRGSIEKEDDEAFGSINTYLFAILAAQWSYMRLTQKFGWSAQEARSILPLCTATELVHTAFVSDWENFFNLRCDSHAHPMAQELAIPLRKEFVKRGLIKERGSI